MANTRFVYEYRHAGTPATRRHAIVFPGEATEADWRYIRSQLADAAYFIPADVGLPELQTELGPPDVQYDHPWHRLTAIEGTYREPTTKLPWRDFLGRWEELSYWNEAAAFARLFPGRHLFFDDLEYTVEGFLSASGAQSRGTRQAIPMRTTTGRPHRHRLDLTGDRPLRIVEAHRLARWWRSHGWHVELVWVRPGWFQVIASTYPEVAPRSTGFPRLA